MPEMVSNLCAQLYIELAGHATGDLHGGHTTRLGAGDLLLLGPGEDHSGKIVVRAGKLS